MTPVAGDAGETVLHLPDAIALADLATFIGRARHVDPSGCGRLVGHGDVLAVYVSPLHERGGPTVIGLRTLALAEPSQTDVTVPLSALLDRFAHLGLMPGPAPMPSGLPLHGIVPPSAGVAVERVAELGRLALPPATPGEQWAGVTPPRQGWTADGVVAPDVIERASREGIGRVAAGSPDVAGAAAVSALRARVWGAPLTVDGSAVPRVPLGAAFAATSLGFLDADPATVHRSGPWTRLSTARGHVLVRESVSL